MARVLRIAGAMFVSLRHEASWIEGTYLTDGRRLLQVVSPLSPPAGGGLAELEDCATGERLVFTARELWALWLRPVQRRARGTLTRWTSSSAPPRSSSG
jgi:hypothetical protein